MPIRPMPTMPSRLPQIRWPSIEVGPQPVQPPLRISLSPSASRRDTARISAIVMSAVSSVRTPGRVGHDDAAPLGRGEVDMVDPGAKRGDQLESGPGCGQHLGIDSVGDGRHQDIGPLHGGDQLRL